LNYPGDADSLSGDSVYIKGIITMVDEQEIKIVDKRSQSPTVDTLTGDTVTVDAVTVDAKTDKFASNSRPTQTEDTPPMDFASFTVGLATQAMMLLGEIPEPQTGKILPTNLAGARQTIDIISLLQEKTKGNLTSDEDKLIQDVLTSLRIEFVKKAKK